MSLSLIYIFLYSTATPLWIILKWILENMIPFPSLFIYVIAVNLRCILYYTLTQFWVLSYFICYSLSKLNALKTKIMLIAPPSIRNEIVVNGTFINGKCIRIVDIAKNLGVLFDGELSFDDQINKVVTSCFTTLRLLSS